MTNTLLKAILLLSLTFLWISCDHAERIMDENGNLSETYLLDDNGLRDGDYTKYDTKGNIAETAHYVRGKLDGERKFYYSDGKLEQVENYKHDILNGECTSYYKNGQVKLTYIYEAGIMNSITKKYSENGVLLEEVQMKDNEENGPFKEYYENGKIKWEGQYLNGDNEYGLLKAYDENGVLIKKLMCDEHGICQTIWTKEKGDIKPKDLNLAVNRKG